MLSSRTACSCSLWVLQLLDPVSRGKKDSAEAVSGFMMIVLVKQIRSHWSAGFLTDSQEKGRRNRLDYIWHLQSLFHTVTLMVSEPLEEM